LKGKKGGEKVTEWEERIGGVEGELKAGRGRLGGGIAARKKRKKKNTTAKKKGGGMKNPQRRLEYCHWGGFRETSVGGEGFTSMKPRGSSTEFPRLKARKKKKKEKRRMHAEQGKKVTKTGTKTYLKKKRFEGGTPIIPLGKEGNSPVIPFRKKKQKKKEIRIKKRF